jgi:type VI protein secretion system component VasK
MRSTPIEPVDRAIELLLATERIIDPVPDDLRARAIERAHGEVDNLRNGLPAWHRFSRARRLTAAFAVAAGVMLVALCAVAFHAVYHRTNEVPPARTSIPAPPIPSTLPEQMPETLPAVAPPTERPLKVKAAHRAKSARPGETYAIEFGLLRPAYHAVARHDFPSALTAIAEHQRRFASGQLAEEREALRIKALLGLERRAEAQQAAVAFRERFPHSVLLRRIEGMLAPSP